MNIYMDAEFDGVRKGNRFIQCLISIGLIAIENDCVVDSYYSLIHPRRFQTLSKTVKRITKLTDYEIKTAPGFREVMDEVNAFLEHFSKPYQLYTFGPDDVRTMKHQAVYEGYGKISAFSGFINLQKKISRDISFEGKVDADMLSLDDLKYIYGINNKVEHNALNDAVDLYLIHEAYLNKAIQKDRLNVIAERKRQKLADAQMRSMMHMQNILFERYHFFEYHKGSCTLYPDVLCCLQTLQDKGFIRLPLNVLAMLITHEYGVGTLTMEWFMHPQPLVKLTIVLPDEKWQQDCCLSYSNTSTVEHIWQLCVHDNDCSAYF